MAGSAGAGGDVGDRSAAGEDEFGLERSRCDGQRSGCRVGYLGQRSVS